MISQTVEYALRAVVCLAYELPNGCTTQRLAEVTKVPSAYLSKVLQGLGRSNLVRSQRGVGGGFVLVVDPAEVSILDVVNSVDPLKRIKTCPLELPTHGANLCPLHEKLDSASALVEEAFQKTTLKELLEDPTRSKPLCDAAGLCEKLSEASEAEGN